jgi:hypothetical protein
MTDRLVKECVECHIVQPLINFHTSPSGRDGHVIRCKHCVNTKRRTPGALPRYRTLSDGRKRCSQCHLYLSPDFFRVAQGRNGDKSGKSYVCNDCLPLYTRNTWYKHQYGITYQEFQRILDNQNGRCASCNDILKTPCLDHNHTTGKIRGILCLGCNTALGSLQDDPVRVASLLEYAGIHYD